LTVYLDSSALMRIVLREAGALDGLRAADALVSSELLAVEAARTIDRLRLRGALSLDDAAYRQRMVQEWMTGVDLVAIDRPVLARASEPLPAPLGTLDALHLATALLWRDRQGSPLLFATHDTTLGLAARMFGFEVRGCGDA
jgi:predicted nucleic acid-binding protein